MKEEMITGSVGTVLSVVGTATQTNEILQTISLVITILGALFTYIIVPLIVWYKKSNEDGKITKNEVEDGIEIVKDGSKKVKEKINSKKED